MEKKNPGHTKYLEIEHTQRSNIKFIPSGTYMTDLPQLPSPGSSKEVKDEWINDFQDNFMDQWFPPNQETMDKKIFQNIIKLCPEFESVESAEDFHTCDYRLKFQQISVDLNSNMDELHEKLTAESVIYTCDFEYHFVEDDNDDLKWAPSEMEFYGPDVDIESSLELKDAMVKSIKKLFSLAHEIGAEPLLPQEIDLSGTILILNTDGSYEYKDKTPYKFEISYVDE